MFRAFLLFLASASVFFWHKTRLSAVRPLSDDDLTTALRDDDSGVREELTRELRKVVQHQQNAQAGGGESAARAPSSVEEGVIASAGPPAGVTAELVELESHLYDDVAFSVNSLQRALESMGEDQHEERAYALNMALRLGYDVAPQLAQIGMKEIATQVRAGENAPIDGKRMECLRVGLRLLVYNSTDPAELREQYQRLRDALPSEVVRNEMAQVFPPDVIQQAEANR